MVRAIFLGWSGLIGKCRSILQQLARLVNVIKWKAPLVAKILLLFPETEFVDNIFGVCLLVFPFSTLVSLHQHNSNLYIKQFTPRSVFEKEKEDIFLLLLVLFFILFYLFYFYFFFLVRILKWFDLRLPVIFVIAINLTGF